MTGFLLKAFLISFSGVMSPGPITAATIAAGTRRRHAGALVALGHGVVELPLMVLIAVGAGKLLKSDSARIVIALAGGSVLLAMGVGMLVALRRESDASVQPGRRRGRKNPFWIGVFLTAGNPFFIVWWAAVGLALVTEAAQLGVMAFVLFALMHWLCDLMWLEALTLASYKGSQLLGRRGGKVVPAICAVLMMAFGVSFFLDAAARMTGAG